MGLTHERLEKILGRILKSTDQISEDEHLRYLASLNVDRKLAKLKPKKPVRPKNMPDSPWNRDNLKVRARILKK